MTSPLGFISNNDLGAIRSPMLTELDGVTYAVPATPGSGRSVIYFKDNHLLYTKDSTGAERALAYTATAASFTSVSVTGTAGAGFVDIVTQSSAPSAPASGGRIFFNSGGWFAYRLASDGYIRSLIGAITANRAYTLPDYDGQFATLAGTETFSNKTLTVAVIAGASITGDVSNTATGFFAVASGTTGQRPGSPANGMIRYNSSTSRMEFYAAAGWRNFVRLDGDTMTGALSITGSSDAVQLDVRGSDSQASALQTWSSYVASGPTTTVVATIDANGHIGLGSAAASSSNVLTISKTVTDITGTTRGQSVGLTHALNANNAFAITGSSINATVNQGAFNATNGTGVVGLNTQALATGASGTVTRLAAQQISISVTGGGTVTSGYGLSIISPTVTASTLSAVAAIQVSAHTTGAKNTYVLLGTAVIPTDQSWAFYSTTANDSSFAGKLKLGANTIPATTIDVLTSDSATATVTNVATIGHDSSGTPAANYGTGIDIKGKSSTTTGQEMGRIYWQWSTATHATRKAYGFFTAFDTAERIGLTVGTDGSNALIGFFNVTPVARTSAYTQTYSTTSRTVNPASTSAFTGQDNAQAGSVYAKLTDLNTLRTDVLSAFQVENSIIDDLQAYGLFQ